MNDVINKLAEVLQQRKEANADNSYVASLYDRGINTILKKVGEEAAETIIAAKDSNQKDIVYETADLWFHTMVMLKYFDIEPSAVLDELDRRFGLSGIEEKASRKK